MTKGFKRLKKISKNICRIKKNAYLCTRFQKESKINEKFIVRNRKEEKKPKNNNGQFRIKAGIKNSKSKETKNFNNGEFDPGSG